MKQRKKTKVIRNNNDELIVEKYPKKKHPTLQKPNFKPYNSPGCQRNVWTETSHRFSCQTLECEFNINKQKHHTDKKLFRQYPNFSTRIPFAKKG